jgi:hypothetical protein
MYRTLLALGAVGIVGLALCQGTGSLKLMINGKAAKSAPIRVKDKLYVPVEALKEAGLSVSVANDTVTLAFTKSSSEGGANQQDGQEGKVGEWLFNGIWRLKVISFEKRFEGEGPGYKAIIEVKNGTKFGGYSLAGTGWAGITLVLEDGNAVAALSDAVGLRDAGLAQGAGVTETVVFETDSTSKPQRIILRLDPKGLEGTPLKYAVANPSFRIRVDAP